MSKNHLWKVLVGFLILFLVYTLSENQSLPMGEFDIDVASSSVDNPEGCTVGAAMGNATTDGRPFSWKNRDGDGRHFIWFETSGGTYNYIAMGTDDGLKMGVNEAGFSLQNSLCEDLETSGYDYDNNTEFKTHALLEFGSVEEARQAIIEDTSGIQDLWPPPAICVNFSDGFGFASTFELGGDIYYEYDPTNPTRLAQFPKQFVVRANDPHENTDHTDDSSTGGNRYVVARDDMQTIADTDGLNVSNWINLVSRHGEPGVDSAEMPSRIDTRGVMLVHGVNEGEDPQMVTGWVALGNPDYTGFIPVWVAQQNNLSPWVTSNDSTNSISGLSDQLLAKRDENHYDQYINSLIRPLEDNIIEAVSLARLRWSGSEFVLNEAIRIHMEAADSLWHTMNAMNSGEGRDLNITPYLTAITADQNGLQVDFSAVSGDDDGSIAAYDWDFGDGSTSSVEAPNHVYESGGIYLVRCRVVDNAGSRNSKWLYINLSDSNQPPSVFAGEDASGYLNEDHNLAGVVSDDGLPTTPGTTTATWEKISGPGVVVFGDKNSAATSVSFSEPGFYVLRLSAYDGQLLATDEVGITVNQPNTPPTVWINSPLSGWVYQVGEDINFSASSDDADDGSLNSSIEWYSDLDGVIGSGATFSTSELSEGTHTITAEVTDSGGLTGSDQIVLEIIVAQGETQILEVRVSQGSDDAEECLSDSSIDITSSDLEFVRDYNAGGGSLCDGNQVVGIRFPVIDLPEGAMLTNSYIQFQTDESSSEVTLLNIYGESTDDALTFTESTGDISGRLKTTAFTSWDPVPWTVIEENGENQRTPNLAAIVQEIIDRPGWLEGNAIAFLFEGSGNRTAESYDGSAAAAPLLHVEYVAEINQPPDVAIASPSDHSSFKNGEQIRFSASATDEEDGDLSASIEWRSDLDGIIGSGGGFTSIDLSIGTHVLEASVVDSGGLSGAAQVTVNILQNRPQVTINSPLANMIYPLGNEIVFSGTVTDVEDGDLTDSMVWESSIDGQIGIGGSFSLSSLSEGIHHILASATDSFDETGYASIFIVVSPQTIISQNSLLVKDVSPGLKNSYIRDMVQFNEEIFFIVESYAGMSGLWKTDGTPEGTVLVSDAVPISNLIVVNNSLFFRAYDSGTGYGLWKSDGTAEGTLLVKNVSPSNMVDFNGILFFSGNDISHGYELWKSDGTEAGTTLVKDIYSGSSGSGISFMTVIGDTLFFEAADLDHLSELWKSDGTESGTMMVADLSDVNYGPAVKNLTDVNGVLFFTVDRSNSIDELWKTDGTAEGTELVIEMIESSDSPSRMGNLTAVGDTLFFSAYDLTHGYELWKSDGTELGTVLVKDIVPGFDTRSIYAFIEFRDLLYFLTTDDQLWKSDGTESGTQHVDTIPAVSEDRLKVESIYSTQNLIYFASKNLVGLFDNYLELWEVEHWVSNGGINGSQLIHSNQYSTEDYGALIRFPTATLGDQLYYFSGDYTHGMELWRFDMQSIPPLVEFDLVIAIEGNGSVSKTPDLPAYESGELVELTPIPDPGWNFAGWSGPQSEDLTDNEDGTWGLLMNGDKSVTATFAPNQQPIAAGDQYATDEDTPLIAAAPGVLANDTDPETDPLTAVKVTDPLNGTVTLNADGSFTYTPNLNFNGSDSFTYTANDGLMDSNIATVNITVNPINDNPVANLDIVETFEETPVVIHVLENDTDVDHDPLTVIDVMDPHNGTAVITDAGTTITYTPDPGHLGQENFSYTISDGQGGTASMKIYAITVSLINNPPSAVDDNHSTTEDTDLVIAAPGVLANDTDPDSDPLSAEKVTNPENGTVTLNSDGSFSYTPNLNFNGFDSFTYTASDGQSDSNTATVNITVVPINDAPVANADFAQTAEETLVEVPVLDNDIDVDLDLLIVIAVSDPTNGTAVITSGGTIVTYTPDLNFNGTDTFTYTISDNQGGADTAAINITVNPINDPPTAVDDNYNTPEDTNLVIAAPGLLANDSDLESDPLSAIKVTNPANGIVTFNSDGSFTYSPNLNFTGLDTFSYKSSDGFLDSNIATVNITVDPINDAPTAVDDNYNTPEDTELIVAAAGVLANDSDPEMDPLSAVKETDPTNGTVTLNSDGSFTYIPNLNYAGMDSFTYHAEDGLLDSNIATVNINIGPANDPPAAIDDTYSTDEDIPLSVDLLLGVLSNDTDPESDPLSAILVDDTENGTVSLNPDGSFTYTPNLNFNGIDTFTYKANDGFSDSNTATVTITISPINDVPVAVDDNYVTGEDTPLFIAAPGILDNDSDPESVPLTAIKVTNPTNGSLIFNADGSFTYTPNANFNGSDSFTYTANDGVLNSNTATISIAIYPINDEPVAIIDYAQIEEDTPVVISVLDNDSDVEFDPLLVIAVSDPTNGTAVITDEGTTITYSPDLNFNGADDFTYTISDGQGGADTATVYVTVNPVNDPPVAVDDATSTNQDTPKMISVLANDSDADLDTFFVTNVSDPSNGAAAITNDGTTVTYTPDAFYSGFDTFTYSISDGKGGTDTASVHINIVATISDTSPPAISFITPFTGGTLFVPRAFLVVNASDAETAVERVEFEAFYSNSWHPLGTDTDPSDGWKIQWNTGLIADTIVEVRATAFDYGGNSEEAWCTDVELTSLLTNGSGYQYRESPAEPVQQLSEVNTQIYQIETRSQFGNVSSIYLYRNLIHWWKYLIY